MTPIDDHDLDAYDYTLPAESIAQHPTDRRSASRLLELPRTGPVTLRHHQMGSLAQLLTGDELIVFNNAKVVPARLHGHKVPTGGAVELLALNAWDPQAVVLEAIGRSSKKMRPGTVVRVGHVELEVQSVAAGGHYALGLPEGLSVIELLDAHGQLPLPPYIARAQGPTSHDDARYQTTFASVPGAAAAPTAGLHFDDALMRQIRQRGCQVQFITLHVGLGTFLPVRQQLLKDVDMHAERLEIPAETAAAVHTAGRTGRPVLAVGTTVVRALEGAAAAAGGRVCAGALTTKLFLRPGSEFKVVDQLLTNFHLPKSTLLMLVSAFAGRQRVLGAYQAAIQEGYRFYSYGDAMVIR